MGALRKEIEMEPDLMLPLTTEEEMHVIGHDLDEVALSAYQELLRARPDFAKIAGRQMRYVTSGFADAFPGETRTKFIPVNEWRRGGHEAVAETAELMGLEEL